MGEEQLFSYEMEDLYDLVEALEGLELYFIEIHVETNHLGEPIVRISSPRTRLKKSKIIVRSESDFKRLQELVEYLYERRERVKVENLELLLRFRSMKPLVEILGERR